MSLFFFEMKEEKGTCDRPKGNDHEAYGYDEKSVVLLWHIVVFQTGKTIRTVQDIYILLNNRPVENNK